MERRFRTAVLAAVVLHGALIGFTMLRPQSEAFRGLGASLVVSATEVEVLMLTADDSATSVRDDRTSSNAEHSGRKMQQGAARTPAGILSQRSAPADAEPELDGAGPHGTDATLAELDPSAEQAGAHAETSDSGPRVGQRVDLGLNGSVMRDAALQGREPAPRARRRRPTFSLGHWSQNAVQTVAQGSAPWEGQALLTLEWSSSGQLVSVKSSAASSSSAEWQRLAQSLTSKLAARPNASPQGKGLRVVYLIKSGMTLPESKRSVLPDLKYAHAEKLTGDNLPPANALNFGVKADGSAATTRTVSVELVRSDTL